MGYKIITSKVSLKINDREKKYLRFHEGFLFQWLNPKAWIAALSGISMFSESTSNLIIFVILYFLVCYLCLSFWGGLLGHKSTNFLNNSKHLQKFNILMGSILIFSALSILFSNFGKFTNL